ncbi:hypothetical protein ABH944_001491 [Caballeronia udeis]|uniref:Uncharacterized protein n=1 Tax=Caballeronia udeis TaxID=1232866 RepID=A0ABW8MGF1_9BURK
MGGILTGRSFKRSAEKSDRFRRHAMPPLGHHFDQIARAKLVA